jgi:NADH:ubiquinone oxidoreductase subunit C
MTATLSGTEIAKQLTARFPEAVIESSEETLVVRDDYLFRAAEYLKTDIGLDYLVDLTAVDYVDYFEVVYHLVSLEQNRRLVLKTRSDDRKKPTLPSVVTLWKGADFLEREIFDLMGIRFEGHPNLKRIVLWEGFEGYPLRKEYL